MLSVNGRVPGMTQEDPESKRANEPKHYHEDLDSLEAGY